MSLLVVVAHGTTHTTYAILDVLVERLRATPPHPSIREDRSGDVWSAALLLAAALGLHRVVRMFLESGAKVNVSMRSVYSLSLHPDAVRRANV